jgi:hypothetical protein
VEDARAYSLQSSANERCVAIQHWVCSVRRGDDRRGIARQGRRCNVKYGYHLPDTESRVISAGRNLSFDLVVEWLFLKAKGSQDRDTI